MRKKLFILISAIMSCLCCQAQHVDTLYIANGSRLIYGLMNRLETSDGPRPLAIVAHGFNGSHDFGKNYFKPLAEAGFQCFTFDFPCGSTYNRTDRNTMNMSIIDQQNDLRKIIEYFSSREDVDSSSIVLIGESQGGLVASLLASSMPDKISRLILVFPAFGIPDIYNTKFGKEVSIPDTTYVWDVPLGKRYFTELRDVNAWNEMPKYTNPVLIVQGNEDSVVPVASSEKALGLYPDAQLKIINGAGHGFNPKQFDLAARYIKDFLNR